jgi:hypothetical protein
MLIEYLPYDVTMFWLFFRWERYNLGHIYLQCFPTGKLYAGQTIQLVGRMGQYSCGYGSNPHHSNAIQKHGWANVNVLTVECPWYMLDTIEIFLIEYYDLTDSKKGYNKTTGGRRYWTHSKETKKKISEAMTGEKHPMYGKTGEKNPFYGKTHTLETKQKMSEAQTGKTHTVETKKKMSEALTGEKNHNYGKTMSKKTKQKLSEALSGAKHHKSKKVYRYELDGTFVDSFGSYGEAARAIGKPDKNLKTVSNLISMCARDKREDAHGFKWSHTEL